MTHFLDERGRLGEMPAAARGLARHLGAIVAAVTSRRLGVLRATDVRCRRRPGRRPCPGRISNVVGVGSGDLSWEVPRVRRQRPYPPLCGNIVGPEGGALASERDSERGPGGGKIRPKRAASARPRCGLCGKTAKLTRTECCRQLICDDEDTYVLFSYARNSCHRNHRRFTLCSYHHAERHRDSWKYCGRCPRDFETEIYVYYGTNAYNFEKLENPPAYEPTRCSECQAVIVLSEGGYTQLGRDYWCEACTDARLRGPVPPPKRPRALKPTAPPRGARTRRR